MPSNIIEVTNLVKRYGEVTAVDDITFAVAEGDFFGFLGPNGAGKTTTMRILATLLRKTSGSVSVDGYDVDTQPDGVRRSIGFAMQDVSLDSMASGYENLQLLGVLYGLSPRQSRARAEELVELVGLSKVADRWVNSYSGGMRRRLDLAGTLMHRPKLLFLDEPTQGLDPQARRTIWDYLRDLNRQGTTVFLTTHYMDEADSLCRDLAFIDRGKIVRRGTPEDLKSGMGGDIITLEFAHDADMVAVREAIETVLPRDATLTPGPSPKGRGEVVASGLSPGGKEEMVTTGLSPSEGEGSHKLAVAAREAGALMPRLIQALDAASSPPQSLKITQPTLEDVFVKLVGHGIMDDESQLVTGRDPFIQGRQ